MQLALLPLVRGTVRVQRSVIIEPDLMMEISPSGATNFDMDSGSGGSSIMPKLAFEDVLVLQGKFTCLDSRTGNACPIGVDRMLLQIPSMEVPIRINLDAAYHGRACNVKGMMVPLKALIQPDKKHLVDLTARGGEVLVHVTGRIADVPDFKNYNLSVSANGPSVPDILERFELGGVPGFGPFRVSRALTVAKQGLALDMLNLSVGKEELVNLRLKGSVVDLASLQGVALELK
jgi:hypothetical protein